MEKRKINVALVGNPNAGKTTVFNALTGAKQRIGNWPGVTVDLKQGSFTLSDGTEVEMVDLPGIYSLVASSEDEKVAVEYALSGKADLFVNILDGTNLERNLYLTILLAELEIPMIHVVTMMDIVKARGITIDLDVLSKHLGAPVIGVSASKSSKKEIGKVIQSVIADKPKPALKVLFPLEIEEALEELAPKCESVAAANKAPARWVALRLLEADPLFTGKLIAAGAISQGELDRGFKRIEEEIEVFPDEAIAEARYKVVGEVYRDVSTKKSSGENFTQKADKVILNRWLGIPIFLIVMYIMFWIVSVLGGAFIDFFDVAGKTIFVEGTRYLLESIDAPSFVIALVSGGIGTALQTVGTFIPPITAMFVCLAILEDSGYMARAAFVMDRFMRAIGLPGKSFVPLLVGFGCSVPAIMATRTLEHKRDRFLTIFMTPFMSCGAKLPVYIVFACAFFPETPGRMVFLLYLTGMVLAVIMGMILKRTLFQGEPSPFIMELPPYHLPSLRQIVMSAWERLRVFILRAGKVIVPLICLLGILNTVGYAPKVDDDGNNVVENGKPVMEWTIDNEDSEASLLAKLGTTITPIFKPMGVEEKNWPASVAIFTGLFAKESVVGTLNGLYGQNKFSSSKSADNKADDATVADAKDAATTDTVATTNPDATTDTVATTVAAATTDADNEPAEEGEYDFLGGIKEALQTIPDNLSGVFSQFLDPLGTDDISDDEAEVAESNELDKSVFVHMRAAFTQGKLQAFAYLLFVLLYVPCIAALGAAFRELGWKYGLIFAGYLTLLGWTLATLFYQISLGHNYGYVGLAAAILVAMVISFYAMGRRQRVRFI
ncbi:MAG: ferrous iron transport protein B [Opitutae bacterium]|nr:ferrous iron transport protein B [Opitutae bacterium]